MSIQEQRFQAIADAIRQKDGTDAPIQAVDFAARILAIPTGGGGGSDFAVPLVVTVDAGAQVTAVNGDTSVQGTSDGTVTLILTKPGVWTVTATLGDSVKSTEVEVLDGYQAEINMFSRLPEGYQEVEYIQTVLATSFNSDILVTSSAAFRSFRVLMDFEADPYTGSSSKFLFNSTNFTYASGSKFAFQVARYSAAKLSYYLGNASALAYASINISNTRLAFDCDMAAQTFQVGSEVFTFGAATGTLKTWTPTLFAAPSGGDAAPGKLYAAKMWLSGELVRDFVPCTDPSGVVGLYDLVNGVFYKNSRNGVLTAGPAV